MREMPKLVTVGEEWFVYSMEWLQRWERYVYFDLIEESKPSSDEQRPHPGPVDCSSITEPPNSRLHLTDGRKQSLLENRILKPNLQEGKDFMLVDKKVHEAFEERYGLQEDCEPIPRYGIKCADGEVIVELTLRKLSFVVLPNAKVFNFADPRFILVSRNDTLKAIELKLQKALTNYLYTVMKNKDTLIRKFRLWKSLYETAEEVFKLESDKSGSKKLDGDILNKVADKEAVVFDDLNLVDSDLIIIELAQSNGSFAFKKREQAAKVQIEESKGGQAVGQDQFMRKIEETALVDLLNP